MCLANVLTAGGLLDYVRRQSLISTRQFEHIHTAELYTVPFLGNPIARIIRPKIQELPNNGLKCTPASSPACKVLCHAHPIVDHMKRSHTSNS